MAKWLVVYDTPDDKRRQRIAHILDDYGDRVQYSVFEVIASEEHLQQLMTRLRAAVDPEEDSVRIYYVCEACAQKVVLIGRQEPKPWWEPEVYII